MLSRLNGLKNALSKARLGGWNGGAILRLMSIPTKSRLTQPLIRENGIHRPASWEEALARVAEGFQAQIRKSGPGAFGMFSCSKTTNELNYAAQKFVRTVIGTNNIDSCNRT